ncbi:FHA domain-containing protein [Tsukamurella sp. 8F]|uniref:FHA domain-containing protein n=1 Tax=unclassified Tsukamurella TaxID=2633480 RepID=UPI0023B8E0F1|nr:MULTISPECIES: FHA domain-containing protein [unclassified Tsukamurella]MDF0528440.1 FHA domain-containing protein [Tsukamurella sp. 8J]MDF0586265.1 FHA domain-containing protein [Tsukamurella sp. 8F]
MIDRRTTVLPGDRVVARVRDIVLAMDAPALDAPAAVPALIGALAAGDGDWVEVVQQSAAPGLSFAAVQIFGNEVRAVLGGAGGATIAIFESPSDTTPQHVLTSPDGAFLERVATLGDGNVVTVTVGHPQPPAPASRPGSLVLRDGAVPASGAVLWVPPVKVPRTTGPQAGPKSQPFPVIPHVDPVPALDPDAAQAAAARPEQAHHEASPADPAQSRPDRLSAPTDMDLEAVAERPPSGPMVAGRRCAFGHLNAPEATFCTRCGGLVNSAAPTETGPRPPLGTLIADDGSAYVLETDVVIGRDPVPFVDNRGSRAADGVGRLAPIPLQDRTGALSRAHLEIRLDGWNILAVDVGSSNGTWVRPPGVPSPLPLVPGQPALLAVGSEINLGGRVLVLQANEA